MVNTVTNNPERTASSRDDFVSVREAARLLGIGTSTIQRLVDTGTLTAWKTAGGHRRILRGPLEALIGKRTGGERPLTVLICDRHAGDREAVEQKLASSKLSLAIHSTGDWLEAIVIAARYRPDFWIVDPDFPDVDAWDVTTRLLALVGDANTGVVVASRQMASERILNKMRGSGVMVYDKPLPIREIQGMLKHSLATHTRTVA